MLRWTFIALLVVCGGCQRYYRVSEPQGGREYFTTKVDEQGSGAVKFDDMRTGGRITLQSSEVKEIKKADLPAELQTKS
jgi:hypothetical protein